MHQVKLFRMWGDCYGYFLVATGYADIMIDPIMNPWDLLDINSGYQRRWRDYL